MKNTTAKEFLISKGVEPSDMDLDVLRYKKVESWLNEFAEIKVQEAKEKPAETFKIEVKNIDDNFHSLRDRIDKISPSFTIVKDTFIFHSADMPLFVQLIKLRDSLKIEGKNIVVTKEN